MEDAIHAILAFLQLQSFVLQPVEQVQLISSSHALGTGGNQLSTGIREVSFIF